MERYIGKMLDNRYEILEVIGTGGMAVVFKAKCHLLNRLVAIKVLKTDLADDADFRRRFHDESQAVAKLSHPNIVSVYDVSRGGELEYIVMELIDGISLKQYMERRGQLNWRESLHFITQIMRGLSHAHSRGIIHRDIKPHNVMVLRDGSVKVADFGIACLAVNGQTMTNETLGSVHYISPEQAKGDRTDARSDIYSAGVVLYEMLTSRLPFEGETPVSIAIQHFSAVPLGPREINDEIPEALEKICLKAMAPGLDKRYGDAEEMIHDLEEFRKNPEINFDYDVSELRQQPSDEPTRFIPSSELQQHKTGRMRPADYDDEDDEDDRPRIPLWAKLLLAVAIVAAGIWMANGLFNFILASFTPEPVKEYEVPKVVGYTIEQARQLPEVKDIFTINETGSRPSEDHPTGTILEQDPVEGKIKRGDLVINVVTSQGGKTAVMPHLVENEWKTAEQILKNMKMDLQIEIVEERHSETIPEGFVISTTPASNETLHKGDKITFVVSLGPKIVPVTVPSFLGMPREEAQSNCDTLNLKVTFVEVEDEAAAGTVIAQDISPSDSVNPGSPITLTVSTGPAVVLPPEGGDGGAVEPPVDGGETGGGEIPVPEGGQTNG